MPSSRYERAARSAGYRTIAGLDEAGRGALFGPVFAAAVVLDPGRQIRGLDDSKELEPERREMLAGRIRERAVAWAVGAAGVVVHQRSTGEPWQRISLGREVNTWLRGVFFLNKNDGWVVGGYGHILHTTDGGQTWLQMFG